MKKQSNSDVEMGVEASQAEDLSAPLTAQTNRRRLLQLGAVGLPMLITVRAGAQSTLISQLQCILDIPAGWVILVQKNGKAWMGPNMNYDGKPLTNKTIKKLKREADFTFPKDSVPSAYRPTEDDCRSSGGDDDGSGDDSKGDDGGWGWGWGYGRSASTSSKPLDNAAWAKSLAPSGPSLSHGFSDPASGNGADDTYWGYGDDGSSGDDDDDDGGNSKYCSTYKVYTTTGGVTGISSFVDESGNWTIPEDGDGLYIHLARIYLSNNGLLGDLPGISCLHSVLTYFNQL